MAEQNEKIDKILLILQKIDNKIELLEKNTEYIINIIKIPFNWTYDKINTIRNSNIISKNYSTINDQD